MKKLTIVKSDLFARLIYWTMQETFNPKWETHESSDGSERSFRAVNIPTTAGPLDYIAFEKHKGYSSYSVHTRFADAVASKHFHGGNTGKWNFYAPADVEPEFAFSTIFGDIAKAFAPEHRATITALSLRWIGEGPPKLPKAVKEAA